MLFEVIIDDPGLAPYWVVANSLGEAIDAALAAVRSDGVCEAANPIRIVERRYGRVVVAAAGAEQKPE